MKSALNALCLAILCLCVLNGCVQPIVLENLGIAIALGYDAAQEAEQEDKLRVTAVLINPEPEAKQKTKVVSCTANSSKGANIYLNRQLSRTLVNGQVRVVLFDGKLGDQGIKEIADTLTRDLFIKKNGIPCFPRQRLSPAFRSIWYAQARLNKEGMPLPANRMG